jgi:uncharacterized protein
MPTQVDTVLVKTASRCNLDCAYCYVYHLNDDGWKLQQKRLSPAVIDAVIDQLASLSHNQPSPFSVVLHGGEPLLLGKELMRRLIGGLARGLAKGCGIHVQTNGVLLDDGFIELFAEHDVGISISFDGPVITHDKWRRDHRGEGSHSRVVQAIERLRCHPKGNRLFTGILAVIDPTSSPTEVYQSLKETGAPGFDLLYRDGNRSKLPYGKSSLLGTEFGAWMCQLLEIYVRDANPPRIRVLDDMMRIILGGQGRKEGVGLNDYGILVIETDGSIAKNDTLKVAHRAADRFEQTLSVLDGNLAGFLLSDEAEAYNLAQKPTSAICKTCANLEVCGGGMTAHRWSDDKGFDNPSVFCEDQKLLIASMRRLLAAQLAA